MAALANYQGMARATIVGRLHGSVTNNVLFFGLAGELGNVDWPARLAELATAIITCVTDTLLPATSSEWKFEGVRVQAIDPVLTEEVYVGAAANAAGALTESLPSFNSAVLSIRTGMGGKSKRGRMYVPGIPEAGQSASALTPGQLALIVAFATCLINAFIQGVGAGEWRLGIYSRKLGGTKPHNMALGFTPATNILSRANLGSTNSRKAGRGN